MSHVRINSISIKNYRSFGEQQNFFFPKKDYKKPVAIVGYNNCGKTNLMNAILYGVGYKFVSENSFSKSDLHNLDYNNSIKVESYLDASPSPKNIAGTHTLNVVNEDGELRSTMKPSFFGALKHYNIFFINFHCIKDEISTQRTSWGSLKSFLAKHIEKIVELDEKMKAKKEAFEEEIKKATDKVFIDSDLDRFVKVIKKHYKTNLQANDCEVVFGLPDYEDIFLQMMFRVGLNCSDENPQLIPVSHFGDGYISMFIMAVIQAIAETDTKDECLFLFEEPESFLHENHQEYFYKKVLCNLAKRNHQVIYTTHSAKMVDIFDTKGIIRLEFDEKNKQTEIRFNDVSNSPQEGFQEPIRLETYNSFIKSVEPNLNKLLFSRKAILVEGPNDVMAYKYAIERKIIERGGDIDFAQTYLSFLNIVIIPHHGKTTAHLLIALCNHFNLDYFLINDWDLDIDLVSELSQIQDLETLKASQLYKMDGLIERDKDSKGQLTTNWNLINKAKKNQIHFNIRKLERVLGYEPEDKSSIGIWNKLNTLDSFSEAFFPPQLEEFLEFNHIEKKSIQSENLKVKETLLEELDDLPF